MFKTPSIQSKDMYITCVYTNFKQYGLLASQRCNKKMFAQYSILQLCGCLLPSTPDADCGTACRALLLAAAVHALKDLMQGPKDQVNTCSTQRHLITQRVEAQHPCRAAAHTLQPAALCSWQWRPNGGRTEVLAQPTSAATHRGASRP